MEKSWEVDSESSRRPNTQMARSARTDISGMCFWLAKAEKSPLEEPQEEIDVEHQWVLGSKQSHFEAAPPCNVAHFVHEQHFGLFRPHGAHAPGTHLHGNAD